jgi:hypothetical protein
MKCNLCSWDEQPDSISHLKRTVEACMNTGPCMDRNPVVVWRGGTFEVVDPQDVILEDNKKKKIVADVVIEVPLERHIAPPMTTISIEPLNLEENSTVETTVDGVTTVEEVTVIPE